MGDSVIHTNQALRLQCERVVQALVERYEWFLLSQDRLVELVLKEIALPGSPAESVDVRCIEKQAKHQYTAILYDACRQKDDLNRREQGYTELFRFLFRVAHNRWPELAQGATQRALVLVYEQIERCRSPGAFLAFALYKLRHAFKQEQRARIQDPRPIETIPHLEADQTTPAVHLEEQECRQLLLEAVMSLPRAPEQKVILLKFFDGLSDMEIGERLGITTGYVRVLRHRGIDRLRQDERLRDFFGER
ncbi:MAG: sigma-70 family RNA polymerase sigma factor [Anaerolineae bacterium]|nr:sigma-70 family RNA polymerase sigma factor [Anaerolineae bacterium]